MASSNTELDRKSLKQPDSFMVVVQNFFTGLSKHSHGLLAVLGVLFLIGLGVTIYLNQKDKKSDVAQGALFHARKAVDKELTAVAAKEPKPAVKQTKQPDGKPAEPEAPNPEMIAHKKFDVDATVPEGVAKLKEVVTKYDGTRAAFEAKLALGDLYYDHGDPQKAIPWYEKATESAPGSMEKALAHYSLGYAFENSKKFADAVRTYEKAIKIGGAAGLKGDLLLAIARCYEGLNDTAKARSTYDQIISQLPNTEHSKTAEILKSQLS